MTAPFGKIGDLESGKDIWPKAAVYLSRQRLILSSIFEEFGSPNGVRAALDEVEEVIRIRIAQDLAQVAFASDKHNSSKSKEAELYGAWQEANFSKQSEKAWNQAQEKTKIAFTSFEKEAENFLLLANDAVRTALVDKFGTERVDLWDFSDSPLRWESPIEVGNLAHRST